MMSQKQSASTAAVAVGAWDDQSPSQTLCGGLLEVSQLTQIHSMTVFDDCVLNSNSEMSLILYAVVCCDKMCTDSIVCWC